MERTVVCFGDSNTYGYQATVGGRFPRDMRWTGRLQAALGDAWRVEEEGFNGRTICMDDPVEGGFKSGLLYAPVCMMTNCPVDLVIVMLGTNDTKQRFGLNAHMIAEAMSHLIETIRRYALNAAGERARILLVAPAPITDEVVRGPFADCFGPKSPEDSRGLAAEYAALAERMDCDFLDAAPICEVSGEDMVHLTRAGHAALADALAKKIGEIFCE